MNDIEILEWVCINKLYIDTHNECDYHNIHTAIENLIQRNKELEEENRIQIGQLNSAFNNGFIHKDKIKEKIEELTKIKGDLATHIATSERIKVLQELLEGSEK